MAAEQFETTPNQGITTLNGALPNSATAMPINSAANLKLSGISSPNYAMLKITKIANWRKHPINNKETFEIVKLTAESGNSGTIVRAQDGTTAVAFADGDVVECVFVSANYQHLVDTITDGTKELDFSGTTNGVAINASSADSDTTINGDTTTVLTVDAGLETCSIGQEAWTGPSYVNSWVNKGGTDTDGGYRKNSLGVVELRGTLKDGTIAAAIFTLPTGYRPAETLWFACAGGDLFGEVQVLSDGRVFASVGVNTRFSLDGISFAV